MEIGIDSFAAAPPGYETGTGTDNAKALAELLERIEFADKVGLVIDIPFFVSDMSFGALSREAKIALSKESAYTS